MPLLEAPNVELGSAPRTPSVIVSPSPSEISSASSPEPQNIRATPLFRALALPPPEPEQPPGQDELERRLPGYRRIVIPRELTLIELLKQCSGVTSDEEVLRIREAKLRVVAERVGLRRLNVLAPRLRSLTLDGSALSSLRDLGIGLVHLKILSVNRCGLTSLDGVWGLGALREFYASGNRVRDPQPLAALQKLHTLNLADNPIEESSRLWMLSVCSSLRRLTLKGTPLADLMEYRTRVASALPLLVSLDDRPLNVDVDDYLEDLFDDESGSESGESDSEVAKDLSLDACATDEPQPGSSQSQLTELPLECGNQKVSIGRVLRSVHRRPATTENAGVRPEKIQLPPRPQTALPRHIDAPTRLQILNTLMDEQWRCSGSKLTSHGAVCGNLARALRRPQKENQNSLAEHEVAEEQSMKHEVVEQTMEEAYRAVAAEIPREPSLEDWARFKQETGIEIDIDFNARPQGADPSKAIERLERIEKETSERLNNDSANEDAAGFSNLFKIRSVPFMTGRDLWPGLENLSPINDTPREADTFSDVSAARSVDITELTYDDAPEQNISNMSVSTFIYRFIVSNVLTLYYSLFFGAILGIKYITGLFSQTPVKLKLEPPSCLTDPKYGMHKYIKANNIKLHYVESGDSSKPLMLFLHGFPEFWYSWRHQIVEFNKDYWCIAIDMRGYGDSERPEDVASYHIDLLIEDVRDLIRQLGKDKCILVAHDWGGLIACRFRDVYPDVLHAAILLGTTSREAWLAELWSNPKQRKQSWYVFFFRMPGLAESVFQMENIFAKAMLVEGKDTVTSQDIECYWYWFSKQFAFTPPINYYRANFVYTLPEKYKDEKVPLLIANAANDNYVSVGILDRMKKEYAQIETVVVDNCGHFLQQEEPQKVNTIIRNFLVKHNI
ncbi:uncharacterized protein [Epargyreus clarus]|uniref:uncharacterized protein n=1 Tax=Epargyreus clarus TaxID=520877 RepID=UPI003C2D1C8A